MRISNSFARFVVLAVLIVFAISLVPASMAHVDQEITTTWAPGGLPVLHWEEWGETFLTIWDPEEASDAYIFHVGPYYDKLTGADYTEFKWLAAGWWPDPPTFWRYEYSQGYNRSCGWWTRLHGAVHTVSVGNAATCAGGLPDYPLVEIEISSQVDADVTVPLDPQSASDFITLPEGDYRLLMAVSLNPSGGWSEMVSLRLDQVDPAFEGVVQLWMASQTGYSQVTLVDRNFQVGETYTHTLEYSFQPTWVLVQYIAPTWEVFLPLVIVDKPSASTPTPAPTASVLPTYTRQPVPTRTATPTP